MDQQIKELLTQFKDELKQDMNTQRNLTVSEIKESINIINDKIEKLSIKVNQVERESRKRNLIIFGISEEFQDYWDLESFVISFLNEKLHLTLDVSHFDFVRRVGKFQENKARPILFGLTQLRIKFIIIKNSPKLKGTNVKISEDYSKEVLQ
uniref:Uncharacterized protein n=1 Tax=Rhodnius prolixus TaxID=13249 RepID=T1I7Z8_RHOPR